MKRLHFSLLRSGRFWDAALLKEAPWLLAVIPMTFKVLKGADDPLFNLMTVVIIIFYPMVLLAYFSFTKSSYNLYLKAHETKIKKRKT